VELNTKEKLSHNRRLFSYIVLNGQLSSIDLFTKPGSNECKEFSQLINIRSTEIGRIFVAVGCFSKCGEEADKKKKSLLKENNFIIVHI